MKMKILEILLVISGMLSVSCFKASSICKKTKNQFEKVQNQEKSRCVGDLKYECGSNYCALTQQYCQKFNNLNIIRDILLIRKKFNNQRFEKINRIVSGVKDCYLKQSQKNKTIEWLIKKIIEKNKLKSFNLPIRYLK